MNRTTAVILSISLFIFLAISWQNIEPSTKILGKKIPFIVPKGWPKPVYDFKKNPITEEGFELGRKLFYDGRLSKDGTVPCASCHQQFCAFATYDHNLSHGINNAFTTRNSPTLFNLAWTKDFMLDGRIHQLEQQPIAPITAPNEMGENMESVIAKLKKDTSYQRMFTKAFGSATITTPRIMKALTQYMLLLVSSNSKYDKVMRGEDTFILPQKLGYEIFKNKCVSCHTEPLFTDNTYRNIGMTADKYLKDSGRMRVTGRREDSLKFRVPSLRNVAYSAPYGHDGRFFSLMNVFEHYRKKVVDDPTTESLLRHKMPLSNYEIGQLTAFLYSLSDTTFLKDTRFADPSNPNAFPSFIHLH